MQKDFFINNSINDIRSILNSKKLEVKDLLCHSNELHNKFNKEFNFTESFDIDQEIIYLDNEMGGIPYLAKDIYNTKHFKTEMGSIIWKNFCPGNNARVIDNLNYSGGILIGKTVTSEFGIHSANKTLNPFDRSRKVGTSSSGSAVAVSLGVVPFALGTQTAGSIIRPSSFCGIFGMKPTYGLLPRTGILKTTDTLDNPGFMTSNIYSLKNVLDAVRVKGKNYPFVYKNIYSSKKEMNNPFKIGFIKTYCWDYAEYYIKKEILKLLKKIEKNINYNLIEIDPIIELQSAHEVHGIIYDKCISYYFKDELKDYKDKISPSTLEMTERGSKIKSEEYNFALNEQKIISKILNEKFEKFDAVISLSTTSIAPLLNIDETIDPCLIWTLAGIPVVNIPLSSNQEMPFGIQVIASKYKDYQLLEVLNNLAKDKIIRSKSIRPKFLESNN